MEKKTQCGKCSGTEFEAHHENTADGAWVVFIRCVACKSAVGVQYAHHVPSMLFDVLKVQREHGVKLDAIIDAMGLGAKKAG